MNKLHLLTTKAIFYRLMILNLILYSNPIFGQGSWKTGCYSWSGGAPMSYFNATPDNQTFYACKGSDNVFNLEYRFTDIDKATCPKGTYEMEYDQGSDYDIVFTVTDPSAFFSGGVKTITVQVQAKFGQAPAPPGVSGSLPPHGVTGTWFIYRSEGVELTVDNTWNGTPIRVDLKIVDNPKPIKACDSGNPKDPDLIDYWTIDPAPPGLLPPNAIARQIPPSPKITDWTSATVVTPVLFRYLALPDAPPAYENFIVRESFDMPTAGGIFNMTDLLPAFTAAYPSLTDEDMVAAFIFQPAKPNSLGITALNKFDDNHGGYILTVGINLNNVFTPAAIAAKRIGYMLQQNYTCCDSPIATPQIRRRVTNIPTATCEINKID